MMIDIALTTDEYVIARLTSFHRAQVLDHFLRLDEDSVYSRFCSKMNIENIKRYVDKMDFQKDAIFGAFDESFNIVAVGECVVSKFTSGPTQAEVGFSVDPGCQGRGLGGKLMKKIINHAKTHDIALLQMFCLHSNKKSMHLARKHGLKVEIEDGESHAVIEFPTDSPMFVRFSKEMENELENAFAYMTLMHKRALSLWDAQTWQQSFASLADNTPPSGMKRRCP